MKPLTLLRRRTHIAPITSLDELLKLDYTNRLGLLYTTLEEFFSKTGAANLVGFDETASNELFSNTITLPQESVEAIVKLDYLVAASVNILQDRKGKALQWWHKPVKALDKKSPYVYLRTGGDYDEIYKLLGTLASKRRNSQNIYFPNVRLR